MSEQIGSTSPTSMPSIQSDLISLQTNGESLRKPPISPYESVMKVPRNQHSLTPSCHDLSYLNFAPRFLVERGRIMVGHSVDLNLCSGI